jgi:hypothetical protein
VAVELDRDDLAVLRELGQHGAEHFDRAEATVEQQ